MTTERIPTIWDQPLPRTKRESEQRSVNTERFLTIWSRPLARLPKAGA
ncbi:hypothetical protein ACFFU2_00415 [Halomonas alkalicola]|uniref:Uncharacterized protein n=1 Tax=Halomonas alkalicola TaxID=1930622 RepID=A0ABY9H4G4_9GAMM|nr:hypothetical protein [Halomonas alkalicola]WLI73364.1 hypothetical protein B6N23_16910 [Halomonas alkalicola]